MNKSEKKQTVESNSQRLQILDVSNTEYKTDMSIMFKEKNRILKYFLKSKIKNEQADLRKNQKYLPKTLKELLKELRKNTQ